MAGYLEKDSSRWPRWVVLPWVVVLLLLLPLLPPMSTENPLLLTNRNCICTRACLRSPMATLATCMCAE